MRFHRFDKNAALVFLYLGFPKKHFYEELVVIKSSLLNEVV